MAAKKKSEEPAGRRVSVKFSGAHVGYLETIAKRFNGSVPEALRNMVDESYRKTSPV